MSSPHVNAADVLITAAGLYICTVHVRSPGKRETQVSKTDCDSLRVKLYSDIVTYSIYQFIGKLAVSYASRGAGVRVPDSPFCGEIQPPRYAAPVPLVRLCRETPFPPDVLGSPVLFWTRGSGENTANNAELCPPESMQTDMYESTTNTAESSSASFPPPPPLRQRTNRAGGFTAAHFRLRHRERTQEALKI